MSHSVDSEEDWRLECGEVRQRLAHILRSGPGFDCTFLVGLGPHKVDFKAHKLILAAASPVFEAMFYGPAAEGNGPITIPDIFPDNFRMLLHYVYTDKIELNSFSNACDIYYAAEKYLLTHLKQACTSYLSSELDTRPGTAGKMYEFSKFIRDTELEAKSLEVMATHTKAVLNDSSFEELEISTVLKMFKMDRLNIDSELDLYAAVERYAMALVKGSSDKAENYKNIHSLGSEDSTQALPEGNTEEEKCHISKKRHREETIKAKDQNRALIYLLLYQIRFLTLTAEEFANNVALSSLLTERERLSLLTNVVSPWKNVPIPSGFSMLTERRGPPPCGQLPYAAPPHVACAALPRAAPPRAAPPRAAPPRAAPPRAAPSCALPPRAAPPRAQPLRAAPTRAAPPRAAPSHAAYGYWSYNY